MAPPKTKLCFLVQSHYSHTMGGAEYRCKLLIDELCRLNNLDIHYLCRNTDPDFTPTGYTILKYGSYLGKYGTMFDIFNLYKTLNKLDPQIIYQNGLSGITGISALYAKGSGARLICQLCSDYSVMPLSMSGLKGLARNSVERLLIDYGIRNTDQVIGQTNSQCKLMYRYHGRNCDAIIPLGHPLPIKTISKLEKVVVLWIGNLRKIKRPELFVRLANTFSYRTDLTFTMIGGTIGPSDQHTEILKQVERSPNIRYLGQITPEEVNQQLSEGHILVNTSDNEGFSNTFVQAWLREVPVVSLNVDPDNIIEKNNIGFLSKNFEELILDVSQLIINNKLRVKMGKKAAEYAKKKHSIEKMVNVFCEILQ